MATGQAKTKAEELAEQLSWLGNQRHPSELELLRIQRAAEILRKSDFILASMALGILAAIRWDESEMRKQFEQVLQIRPDDFHVQANLARCLLKLDLLSEARPHYELALQIQPADSMALNEAIRASVWSGQFNEAKAYVHSFNKLFPSNRHEFTEFVDQALLLLRRMQIEESEIDKVVGLAMSIIRAKFVRLESVKGRILSDEEETNLSFEFMVDATIPELVNYEEALAEKLAESNFTGSVTRTIAVTFGRVRDNAYATR